MASFAIRRDLLVGIIVGCLVLEAFLF